MGGEGLIGKGSTPEKVNVTLEAMQRVLDSSMIGGEVIQLPSKESMASQLQAMANPLAAKFQKKAKSLKDRGKSEGDKKSEKGSKSSKAKAKEIKVHRIEKVSEEAQKFQNRNRELKAKMLMLLRLYVIEHHGKGDILKKVQEFYEDVALADEALDFLQETAETEEIAEAVRKAKTELNEKYGREIAAGRNIGDIARKAADQGLGTPTSLRDLYRDITGNPRESTALFEEFSKKYAFKDLKKIIAFLLHSLGADLKSKGPSISSGLLHRLITETRSLQAILGVYLFFKNRMHLVQKLFEKDHLQMPESLTFEEIAKQFMGLAAERYISSSKVLQAAKKLGIDESLLAKIIVLSQLRDAIREVALNQIYGTLQRRDELHMAILEALEELEEELEEEEEEEENEKGNGEKS
jgi:type III secretion protein W